MGRESKTDRCVEREGRAKQGDGEVSQAGRRPINGQTIVQIVSKILLILVEK